MRLVYMQRQYGSVTGNETLLLLELKGLDVFNSTTQSGKASLAWKQDLLSFLRFFADRPLRGEDCTHFCYA